MSDLFKLIYLSLIATIGVSVASVHAQGGAERSAILLPVAMGEIAPDGGVRDR